MICAKLCIHVILLHPHLWDKRMRDEGIFLKIKTWCSFNWWKGEKIKTVVFSMSLLTVFQPMRDLDAAVEYAWGNTGKRGGFLSSRFWLLLEMHPASFGWCVSWVSEAEACLHDDNSGQQALLACGVRGHMHTLQYIQSSTLDVQLLHLFVGHEELRLVKD